MIRMYMVLLANATYETLPSWVLNNLEPALWWNDVVYIFAMMFYFYQQYKITESGKRFIFGLFFFALFFGIARTLENIRKFYFADNRINIGLWWIDQGSPIVGIELILRVLYYVFSWISIAVFFYATETQVFQRKTKFIFTASAIWEGAVSIALYFTDGSSQRVFLVFSVIGFFIAGIGFVMIYLIVAFKSTGIIRISSFFTSFGMIFFIIGVMGELPESLFVVYLTDGTLLDAWIIAVLSPASMLLGGNLLLIGYKKMFTALR